MVSLGRTWRMGVVVGVVMVAALGCGGSDSESGDGASATTPDASESTGPAETTTTAPASVGPIEIRLEGTRSSDGNSYPETVRFSLEGPCDGTGACSLGRPDGAAGFGVPGWDVALEPGDGGYTYEGSETLTVDRCGDEVLTDELVSTLSVSVTPGSDGEPAVTVTESWAVVPQAEMSDGGICSGFSATVFTLG